MNFCTHFDCNYLPHALSLANSLSRNLNSFNLFLICMDDTSFKYLESNRPENSIPIHFTEMENYFKDLKTAKQNRNRIEYFFTCTPAVCNYIIKNNKGIDFLTYLDSDLYFFSSPQVIFDEIGEKSISIIEHRFNWITSRQRKFGIYNVGWITFKNDSDGRKCLDDWMKNCVEWCYQKVEKKRFADQKYLDDWPNIYQNVCVIKNVGANVATWNIGSYKISEREGEIFVGDQKLVFYHFANLIQTGQKSFKTNLSRVFVKLKGVLKENIYLPYLLELNRNNVLSKKIVPKKDNHFKKNLLRMIATFSRKLRDFCYKDTIHLGDYEN